MGSDFGADGYSVIVKVPMYHKAILGLEGKDVHVLKEKKCLFLRGLVLVPRLNDDTSLLYGVNRDVCAERGFSRSIEQRLGLVNVRH